MAKATGALRLWMGLILAGFFCLVSSIAAQEEDQGPCPRVIWSRDTLSFEIYTSDLCPDLAKTFSTPLVLAALEQNGWMTTLYAESHFAYVIEIDTVELTSDSIPEVIISFDNEDVGVSRMLRLRRDSDTSFTLQKTASWLNLFPQVGANLPPRFTRLNDTTIVLNWTEKRTLISYARAGDSLVVVVGQKQ